MPSLLKTTGVVCAVFGTAVFHLSPGLSQTAAPITPSGLDTQVNLSATAPAGTLQYDITGGTRAGTNVFHSFGNFDVPSDAIANFLNTAGHHTANIFSRVTGGTPSNLFGTIQTTGFGSANLFLMNPAGIVFGPTASLNVGGSVTFTTADYLRLDKVGGPNAGMFHADAAQVNLLTSASVDAFGFLGPNPGAITIQGSQLNVPLGKGISLIGGNITIQKETLGNGTAQPARLSSSNGQINLAMTQSPGEFLQNFTAAPNINGTSFRSYGSAHFAPGSMVDFSQTGNGKISIRGGQLVLDIQQAVLETANTSSSTSVAPNQDTIHLAPSSSIVSLTFSADRGPDIQLVADRLEFIGDANPLAQTQTGTPVNVLARTNGSGDAGNVALRASGSLELMNFVQLDSSSGLSPDGTALSSVLAPGNAGNVDLTSTHGDIRMTGFATTATSQAGNSSGTAGTVTASAPKGDILLDGANLFTLAFSENSHGGGHVTVTAQNLRMSNFGLISSEIERSPFKSDGISITLSNTLEMSGGSVIAASSVSSASAGDITLTAKNILVTQESIVTNAGFASGDGGDLKIVADTLHVSEGAQLSSGSTRAPNRGRLLEILGTISPTGAGGDITIQPLGSNGSVLIDGAGSGIFADTEGTGAGGTINLSTNRLTIQNGGAISASTTGTDSRATGGSITINATDQVTLTNGSSIKASSLIDPKNPENSGVANAGNISINAGQHLDLLDRSSITTTTESKLANGGNIDIRAIDRVRLVNDSKISTSVLGEAGSGGNIFIDPNVVILEDSDVTAQAVGGSGGNITFITPLFLTDPASIVSASSERGPSGTVTIQSPTSNLSGTVGQLTGKPSPPQVLLQNLCVAKTGNTQSTFLLTGRESLPDEPGGWLKTPISVDHWTGEEDSAHASGLMVRRNGLNHLPTTTTQSPNPAMLSLRHLTPPGFLVRSFARGSTGCPS